MIRALFQITKNIVNTTIIMICIDNTPIEEKATAEEPFVCCFLSSSNSYKCFVHVISPSKQLFEFVIDDNKDPAVTEIIDYKKYWNMLNTLCKMKECNTKESRMMLDDIIPIEWQMVDSARFDNENKLSHIREFLLDKLGGHYCEFRPLDKCLGAIDGEQEIK